MKIKNRTSRDNCQTIQTVVNNKVCCGCGACSVICPTSCIEITYGDRFNYPEIDTKRCIQCGKCLKVCPSEFLLRGIDPEYSPDSLKQNYDCFLMYSPDDDIRLDSSSGGFITGLILHLMDKGLIDGGIVAKCEGEQPLVARSFIATDRQSLLSARASKYAPVSSCVVLSEVLKRPGRYIFVGTPCMVEALIKLQKVLPKLQERIALTIGLVCAGMASRLSTKAYLERYGVDPRHVRRISYRGNGWPGSFRAYSDDGLILERPLLGDELSYLVPADHYLRCWNCLDHFARFADISVSDAWCDEMIETERKGKSAVLVQTSRGKEAVASAIESSDMIAEAISIEDMFGYNKHLVIDPKHSRHAWMAIYQLVFFRRMRNPMAIIHSLLQRQGIGLKTTLKARFDQQYYR